MVSLSVTLLQFITDRISEVDQCTMMKLWQELWWIIHDGYGGSKFGIAHWDGWSVATLHP